MKIKKKLGIASALIVASVLAVGAPAMAETNVDVGGGNWRYEGWTWPGNSAYSLYLHSARVHGSSVYNGNGNGERSVDTAAGVRSSAYVVATAWGNTAYWR